MFYLSFYQYLFITIAYAGSYLLAVGSLYYGNMPLVRFFVIIYCSDIVAQPLFGCLILNRRFSGHYLLAWLFAIGGYILEDFIQFFRNENNDLEIKSADGWEAPLMAFLSRFLFVFGSVISKKFILVRSSYFKLKDKEKFSQKFYTVPG